MAAAEPSLSELFQAHRQGLAGAVRSAMGPSADVAELLQEAFLKCWQGWQRGPRPSDPVAWIFVVTWNVAADARRRRQRRPPHASLHEDEMPAPTTHTSPTHALEQREAVVRAQAAVAGLSDPEQQVFLLRVAGELTFDAVAAALSIPVGTAKTRMRAALQKLRVALGAAPSTEERPR
jgi:RNA polymerase sigma factor (sigma-70 family)